MGTAKMAFASHADRTPLVVRAGLPRTFWTLGIFAEAGLLFTGLYLLAEVTLQPLEADQVSILSAGVLLAFAVIFTGVPGATVAKSSTREDGRFVASRNGGVPTDRFRRGGPDPSGGGACSPRNGRVA
jgi:hypothetical protein